MSDNVNHPAHYTDGKYETIEFIERHLLSFHEGNAVKYISRAGKKDSDKMIEDLEKALWYIKRSSNTEDYLPDAITVHDYIIDKKLSPVLASTISLIVTGQTEDAEKMLKAEIERLKNEEKEHEKFSGKPHKFVECPYFGKVVCVLSSNEHLLTPGWVYPVYGDRMRVNNRITIIFDKPVYCVEEVNSQLNGMYNKDKLLASFVEFKGEV